MNVKVNGEPPHRKLFTKVDDNIEMSSFFSDDGYHDYLSATDALPDLPYEYSADERPDPTYEYAAAEAFPDYQTDNDAGLFQ